MRWMTDAGRWTEEETARVSDAIAEIMACMGKSTSYAIQSDPEFNPIFEKESSVDDDLYSWN